MRYTLRTGTLAIFVTVFLLVLLAEIAYFYPDIKKRHIEESRKSEAQLADQIAAALELFLNNAKHELELVAEVLEGSPLTKQNLDRVLSEANRISPFFKTFYVVDREGTWVSFPGKPSFAGRKLPQASMGWIDRAFETGEPVALDVNHSKVGTLVTGFAVPLHDRKGGGNVLLLRGVIVLSEENSMLSIVRKTKVGESGYAYIVSSQGRLMAHPYIMPDPGSAENDYSVYWPVEMLLQGREGISDYEYRGRTWVAVSRKVQPMGWGVVVQQPREDIMKFIRGEMNRVLLFSLITFILSIPVLSFAIHFSTKPLSRLVGKIRAKQMVPEELFTDDEIGNIAKEFNLLYTDLVNSEEQLRRLNNKMETLREEERKHISREIHDDLGQRLTALYMDLSWIAGKVPAAQTHVHEKINSMSALVSETVRTTQRLSCRLRPPILDALGLVPAAEHEIADFRAKSGIHVDTCFEIEEGLLDPDVSLTLFRILQEALTNIARHAHASDVVVSLKEQDGRALLCIKDNGIGISDEQLSSSQALGILGIKERVHLVCGNLAVRRERGTALEVSVPLKQFGAESFAPHEGP